jgi:acetylornithine deacetylase/succinyl-diaminopimelate desuccinylase-like protein
VTITGKRSEVVKSPPPLTPRIMKPVESVVAQIWPVTPIVPLMSAGATDGAFLTPAGIPTYGLSGMFGDPDGNGTHGLNERMREGSVYKGRDFL